MIDPVQTSFREWHYPTCKLTEATNHCHSCANKMAEQIQQMHLEYAILAKKYQAQAAEITRLERLNSAY
jgi:hypothetical protein